MSPYLLDRMPPTATAFTDDDVDPVFAGVAKAADTEMVEVLREDFMLDAMLADDVDEPSLDDWAAYYAELRN